MNSESLSNHDLGTDERGSKRSQETKTHAENLLPELSFIAQNQRELCLLRHVLLVRGRGFEPRNPFGTGAFGRSLSLLSPALSRALSKPTLTWLGDPRTTGINRFVNAIKVNCGASRFEVPGLG